MLNIKVCFCLHLKIKKQSKLVTNYKNFNELFKNQNFKTHHEQNKILKLQTKSSKPKTFFILQRKRREGTGWNQQGLRKGARHQSLFWDHQQEHWSRPRPDRQPLRLLGRGQVRRQGIPVRLGFRYIRSWPRAELRASQHRKK